jgi:hypothetical protein
MGRSVPNLPQSPNVWPHDVELKSHWTDGSLSSLLFPDRRPRVKIILETTATRQFHWINLVASYQVPKNQTSWQIRRNSVRPRGNMLESVCSVVVRFCRKGFLVGLQPHYDICQRMLRLPRILRHPLRECSVDLCHGLANLFSAQLLQNRRSLSQTACATANFIRQALPVRTLPITVTREDEVLLANPEIESINTFAEINFLTLDSFEYLCHVKTDGQRVVHCYCADKNGLGCLE